MVIVKRNFLIAAAPDALPYDEDDDDGEEAEDETEEAAAAAEEEEAAAAAEEEAAEEEEEGSIGRTILLCVKLRSARYLLK